MFDNIKLFRDIAQSKSISRGAQSNGVSQSAASQQIQELEKRLGFDLLDRSTRPLSLTQAGRLYADLCRDVLRREEEFFAGLDRLKNRVEGAVRVASIYSVGLSELTGLREEFSRRFPAASLQIDYLRPAKIYEALLADQADLGLVSYPEAGKDFHVIPWRREHMAVAASPFHPLAQTAVLLPTDLNGQDFIVFDPELTIRRELDRFFREHGVEIRVAMQFDNIQMIKEAVALNAGLSILPERTFEAEIAAGKLVAIPLLAPELVRPVGIVHRKRKRFHRAAQMFIDLLRQTPSGGKG